MYLANSASALQQLYGKIDIKKELADTDSECIATILNKCIPIAATFSLADNVPQDGFTIIENKYRTTTKFETWTMQDKGDLFLAPKDTRKELNKRQLEISKNKQEYTNELNTLYSKLENYHPFGIIATERGKGNPFQNKLFDKIDVLKSKLEELENEERTLNEKKIGKVGCKVIAVSKMLQNMFGSITIENVLELVNEKGNLPDKVIADKYYGIKYKRIPTNELQEMQLGKDKFILAKAVLGSELKTNGGGPHWALVKKINILQDSNGKLKIEYEVEPSSNNDIGRYFSSEDAHSMREAKVLELVIFWKE